MIESSLKINPVVWDEPLPVAACFDDPTRPLDVDLGCGKGRFLLARAARFPDVNFLGVDRMLRRIRRIDNRARRLNAGNIRLLRVEAYYFVAFMMPPASVRTYFILFPDPWPKAKHAGHRLFNPAFLDALHRTLQPDGVVHIATDHAPYMEELIPIFEQDGRFESIEPFRPLPEEQTDFELYYIHSKPIQRYSIRRKGDPS